MGEGNLGNLRASVSAVRKAPDRDQGSLFRLLTDPGDPAGRSNSTAQGPGGEQLDHEPLVLDHPGHPPVGVALTVAAGIGVDLVKKALDGPLSVYSILFYVGAGVGSRGSFSSAGFPSRR